MKEEFFELAREEIKKVLNGSEKEVDISLLVSPDSACGIIDELGFEDDGMGPETNGWQYDFWKHFELNGKKYCLSGSGWYGELHFGVREQ